MFDVATHLGTLLAVAFAVVAGWVCIAALLALLQRVGLMRFVICRRLLGMGLLRVPR